MDIEIVTTKKKLTKSAVNQMRRASKAVLERGIPLGFICGVAKDAWEIILIQHGEQYYTIPSNYTKGETSVYRKIGRWSQAIRFESSELCNNWWNAYQRTKELATNQIYI